MMIEECRIMKLNTVNGVWYLVRKCTKPTTTYLKLHLEFYNRILIQFRQDPLLKNARILHHFFYLFAAAGSIG